MANRTDAGAVSVHGTNPQYLVEKIVRLKIHASAYWKEHCYALTAETLVDKAVELEYIGGTYGGSRKPAPFLCLVLKMLQLQPELEIVYELIKNEDYKYVTALGCFYLRLIGRAEEVYNYLEPRYNDYRKLRLRETDGKYKIIHVDEFVEDLLSKEVVCDTILPHILKRQILEDQGTLQPRHSALEDQDDDDDEEALLAEIQADKEKQNGGVIAGENELIENPRAAALKPDRQSEERSRRSPSRNSEEEARRKDEKKKRKKEKKKKKYRTRGSESRSRSRSGHRSDSGSRSRSRSKDRKKKKSWKKQLKEKRRDRKRDDSRDRSKSRSRDRDRERKKDRKDDKKREEENGSNKNLDENSDEYWLSLRAKLGLKPM
jgi:pre-mRNA-splicing factor 38A